MSLAEYFDKTDGVGILGTADEAGNVDMAVYTKPYVIDDHTIVFVMGEHLSHQNLKETVNAAYMFLEEGSSYSGKRFYLTKLREEVNTSLANAMRQKQPAMFPPGDDAKKYVVSFHIDRTRPLIGDWPVEE